MVNINIKKKTQNREDEKNNFILLCIFHMYVYRTGNRRQTDKGCYVIMGLKKRLLIYFNTSYEHSIYLYRKRFIYLLAHTI